MEKTTSRRRSNTVSTAQKSQANIDYAGRHLLERFTLVQVARKAPVSLGHLMSTEDSSAPISNDHIVAYKNTSRPKIPPGVPYSAVEFWIGCVNTSPPGFSAPAMRS